MRTQPCGRTRELYAMVLISLFLVTTFLYLAGVFRIKPNQTKFQPLTCKIAHVLGGSE